MTSLLRRIRSLFETALADAFGDAGRGVDALVRPSGDPKFGDYQANVAMGLSKAVGGAPREVAQRLVAALAARRGPDSLSAICEPPEIAGPGFINLRVRRDCLESSLGSVGPAAAEDRLGIEPVGAAERRTVVVDYSSPNVAKQMHVGHLRSTIIGDTIARVLTFQGHEVIRQNHLGDWGTQFGMIILGIWHLCMAQRRGEGIAHVRRAIQALGAAEGDAAAVKRALDGIAARHQQDFDADADGSYFHRFLEEFEVDFAQLLEAYRFVNAVEKAAATGDWAIVHRASGRRTPLAELSKYVAAMLQGVESDNRQELEAWRRARQASLRNCGGIYRRLGVLLTDDDVCGESFYDPFLPGIIEELTVRLGQGVSAAPAGWRATCREDRGALCVFLEKADGTPAFKGPQGDALPLIVRKSDGAYLYATTDLAAALYRIAHPRRRPIPLASERLRQALRDQGGGLGADRLLYVVGSPQKLHFQMFFPVVRALGWTAPRAGRGEVRMEHVMFGSVLGEDGKMLRTRRGDSVTLEELLDEAVSRARALVQENEARRKDAAGPPLSEQEKDEIARVVGIAAVKYADLCQNRNTDYEFIWEKMLAMQGNTAPYLLYAYARIRSIYRKGQREGVAADAAAPLRLEHASERALAMKLAQLGETIDAVAETLLPNILCEFLYDLAGRFMVFYEACPVLAAPDEATRASRLRLCDLTARALKLGLGLLGIGTLERM